MDNSKTKDKELKTRGVLLLEVVLLFIAVIIICYLWFSSTNQKEEYSSCVDDCIYDADDCMSSSLIFDKNYNGYYPEDEYDSCFSDLEMCVLDCNP